MGKGLIIIPAFNEEENITDVIRGLNEHEPFMDILVINDGSTDGTAHVLENLQVEFIDLPFNLGYGGALQTGFKYAVEHDYDFVVQFDADGQHNPEEIRTLVEPLSEIGADIVIGSRFKGEENYQQSLSRKIGARLFRSLTRAITGKSITDITSGFQALSRRTYEFYSQKGNYPSDYPDADVLALMSLCGFKVVEVPVAMFLRGKGKSMHANCASVGLYVLKMLLSLFVVLLRKREIKACL